MTKARDIADFKFENIVDTGTEGTRVATGTNAQRGSTAGQLRFNTDTGLAEYYTGTAFKSIDTAPTVTSIDTTLIDSASGSTTNIGITGQNFASGATVKAIGSNASEITANSVTFNSQSSLTANFTDSDFVNANEPYDIKVINPSGLSATLDDQINVDVAPTWNTASGSLGTIAYNNLSGYSLTSLSATDADGDTIAYSVVSGSTPSNLTLNSSNGSWSGTPNEIANNTTFSFTGRATANSKTTDRSFSIVHQGAVQNSIVALSLNNKFDNDGSSSGTLSASAINSLGFNSSSGNSNSNSYDARFDGSNKAIEISGSDYSSLSFGTGDFTIEMWLYIQNATPSYNARIFQMGNQSQSGIFIGYDANNVYFGNTDEQFVTDAKSNWQSAWHYLALVRSSGTTTLYRDGTSVGSSTSMRSITGQYSKLGQKPYTSSETNFYGRIQEFMISDYARYTTNFSTRTSALIT
jgi:hypothetical protein